jgi:hypothetical protein
LLHGMNTSLVSQQIRGTDNTVSDKLSRIDVGDSF